MRPLLYLCLFPITLSAASVELPAEIKGEPGNFLKIPAKTDCVEVRWVALDAGLNLFPTDLLKDSRTAVVVALKPGRYRVLAYGAKQNAASEPAICTVLIGDAPEPKPEDELIRELRQAYRDEPASDKREAVAALARVYRQASEREIRDLELKTVGELFQRLVEQRRQNIPDGSLLGIRKIIERELNRTLPTNPSMLLDTSMRIKLTPLFLNIATRLEALP